MIEHRIPVSAGIFAAAADHIGLDRIVVTVVVVGGAGSGLECHSKRADANETMPAEVLGVVVAVDVVVDVVEDVDGVVAIVGLVLDYGMTKMQPVHC